MAIFSAAGTSPIGPNQLTGTATRTAGLPSLTVSAKGSGPVVSTAPTAPANPTTGQTWPRGSG